MIKREFQDLLDKYLAGRCSEKEQSLLHQFYDSFQKKPDWDETLGNHALMEQELLDEIQRRIAREEQETHAPKIHLLPVIKVAALVLMLIGSVLFAYQYQRNTRLGEVPSVEKYTREGQKSTVVLSDGSKIRLNSNSRLIFPEKFESKFREVKLEGEAFFEVARDASRPFIIRSGGITTTVLGTSFNVKAFPDEDVQVTVATGKVRVENTASGPHQPVEMLLSPGQQAICDLSSGALEMNEVDTEPYMAWKDGVIRFENISLYEAAKVLERWYGVTFLFADDRVKDCLIGSGTYKDENLYNVLNSFEYFLGIEYTVINQVVTIRGTGCQTPAGPH